MVFKLLDTQARCLPHHALTQTLFSPQGPGAGDEASRPQGERQAWTQGSAPPIMPQSRSSESARVATLPARGPELSAQEQMEGMLCRKQEMEAFGKKAANRYPVWPAGPVASPAPSEEACLEPLPRQRGKGRPAGVSSGEGVGLRSRVEPQVRARRVQR